MKNLISTLLIVFVYSISLSQQTTPVYDATNFLEGIYNINADFYEVKAAGESYFAQDSLYRVGNTYGYKEFLRYVQLWEPRTANDGVNSGNLKEYHKLIHSYSQNRSSVCSDASGLTGLFNWNSLGPKCNAGSSKKWFNVCFSLPER